MDNHIKTNQLTQDTLDRQLLESLAASQRPKTKAERQKPIYYAMTVIGVFCQIISFVLASSGVLYLLVSNFKSATGWILILLAVVLLAIVEAFVWIMLREYHAERLDDKKVNKSTILLLFFALCVSTPLTFIGTPYAVSLFAATPKYIDISAIEARHNALISTDSSYVTKQIIEANLMAISIHNKNNRNGTTRSRAVKSEQAYINQKLSLETLLIDKIQIGKDRKAFAVADAIAGNEIIKQTHTVFCDSFGAWLALVTIGAMFVLFGVRWYCESWKRLYVVEGNIKLQESKDHKEQRLEPKAKDSFRVKEDVKNIEKQPVSNIGFNNKDKDFNRKEGDVLKGIAPKVDRVFVLKDDGTLKAYTLGGLNNLIKGSSEERSKHLETLKQKLF